MDNTISTASGRKAHSNELTLPVHLSSKFTWTGQIGVIEASDVGSRIHSRIYNDACDVGFVVKSTKTGAKRVYAFSHERRDDEGELISLVFIAVGEPKSEIYVLND